jgi:hypothetical protein
LPSQARSGELRELCADSQEHPNGLTRVKILEATGEGADLAVARKEGSINRSTSCFIDLAPRKQALKHSGFVEKQQMAAKSFPGVPYLRQRLQAVAGSKNE